MKVLHIIYLRPNQAWALMWHGSILGIYNDRKDAVAEKERLER